MIDVVRNSFWNLWVAVEFSFFLVPPFRREFGIYLLRIVKLRFDIAARFTPYRCHLTSVKAGADGCASNDCDTYAISGSPPTAVSSHLYAFELRSSGAGDDRWVCCERAAKVTHAAGASTAFLLSAAIYSIGWRLSRASRAFDAATSARTVSRIWRTQRRCEAADETARRCVKDLTCSGEVVSRWRESVIKREGTVGEVCKRVSQNGALCPPSASRSSFCCVFLARSP